MRLLKLVKRSLKLICSDVDHANIFDGLSPETYITTLTQMHLDIG